MLICATLRSLPYKGSPKMGQTLSQMGNATRYVIGAATVRERFSSRAWSLAERYNLTLAPLSNQTQIQKPNGCE